MWLCSLDLNLHCATLQIPNFDVTYHNLMSNRWSKAITLPTITAVMMIVYFVDWEKAVTPSKEVIQSHISVVTDDIVIVDDVSKLEYVAKSSDQTISPKTALPVLQAFNIDQIAVIRPIFESVQNITKKEKQRLQNLLVFGLACGIIFHNMNFKEEDNGNAET